MLRGSLSEEGTGREKAWRKEGLGICLGNKNLRNAKDWWKIGQNRWFRAEPWNARNGIGKILFYIEGENEGLP